MKKGIIFETLGSTENLQITESKDSGEVRLHGVFGKCGIRNNNNRVYEKKNYGACVEEMQSRIAKQGVLGELEHPASSFNVNLNNVSHKIESIEMKEDGTIEGTILLLNTAKGKDAQAIVEGGCPLFISSRAAGSVDAKGNVTLQTIATYDLVGTPGFSEARLELNESQKLECLNESAGNNMWMIVESEEPDNPDDVSNDSVDSVDVKEEPTEDPKGEEKKTDKLADNTNEANKVDIENSIKQNMEEINKKIDSLVEQVKALEAELHVQKESCKDLQTVLDETSKKLNEANEKLADIESVNYQGIQSWIEEYFAPEFGETIKEQVKDFITNYICEEVAPSLEKWINEEYSNTLQGWISEEFASKIQDWVCEEFTDKIQDWLVEEFATQINNWVTEEYDANAKKWICEEFADKLQNWVNEELMPDMHNWVTEECLPEYKNTILEEMNANVSAFLEAQKESKYASIDKMLESLSSASTEEATKILNENRDPNAFAGIPAIDNMPIQYKAMWESLSTEKQTEIARSSRMYDFTKSGVLESFWANQFNKTSVLTESANAPVVTESRANIIAKMMKKMR